MSEHRLPDGRVDRLPPAVKLSMKRPMPAGHDCHYCGTPATTRDHVVAKTRGGSNACWNLVPACLGCNNRKGARADRICPCPGLFERGWCRRWSGRRALSKFAVTAPPLPLDLSIEAYERTKGFGPTPHHEGLPRSFDGSA
jgi:hypothetical protein